MTRHHPLILPFFAAALWICGTVSLPAEELSALQKLRAPAYPLIVHDPYFSIWSFGDKLTDVPTTHWTGSPQPITGIITVDGGKPQRLMGDQPAELSAMNQISVKVTPTQTICQFADGQIVLTLRFTSPMLPEDIDLLSRPLTYLTCEAVSSDGREHHVTLNWTVDPVIAVNTADQDVVEKTIDGIPGLAVLQVGHKEQPVLEKKGDNIRMDWGYFYLAANRKMQNTLSLVPRSGDREKAKTAPLLQAQIRIENVGEKPVSDFLMFAYDDVRSIRYFGKDLAPYWRRNGLDAAGLLQQGAERYDEIMRKCRRFDEELVRDLTGAGGWKYAELCALVYRQTWGANKIAAADDGTPYMFSKENFSNGCIGTVDVLYPHTPFLLLFSPQLLKGSLVPVLHYAESEKWPYDYAPHDLGTYPHAAGQVYGMGKNAGDGARMPVEESGNMLIIIAALAKTEGNADFSLPYWNTLTKWADYLVEEGYDPENQLCSADMFGHLAHVTNLSLKAILGIGAYAELCERLGKTEDAKKYRAVAEDYARKWLKDAQDEGRTRLAFDKPGTWSMKHNLVWDSILETHLFPVSLAEQEIAWYKKVQGRYGLPVDSRTDNSLIDWALWSMTSAKTPHDFETLFNPIYDYVNETPDRVPVSDWFFTTNARRRGFQARSVVGGVYIKMLTDSSLWKKYVNRAGIHR